MMFRFTSTLMGTVSVADIRKIIRDSEGDVWLFFTDGTKINASRTLSGSLDRPSHDRLLWEK